MSDDTTPTASDIHEDHYCQHPGCRKWGCFGFEEAKGVIAWMCYEHQPEVYRGMSAFRAPAD